ncbi:hypothetical protein EVAR_37658_1 [Eumeta japonica]|uniref:Uncharacterized protein n=1 Tax=Eumeta variegata TaxID=151549 RepID=A0A4C1VR13_EUMVA|nr:hypothetical protein EVAR_37658_1 [Eumeta japonica]
MIDQKVHRRRGLELEATIATRLKKGLPYCGRRPAVAEHCRYGRTPYNGRAGRTTRVDARPVKIARRGHLGNPAVDVQWLKPAKAWKIWRRRRGSGGR